jgi:cell wall-associated NlpC family hydrolase
MRSVNRRKDLMPHRSPLFAALGAVAVVTLSAPHAARAQEAGAPTSTLDMTIPTGAPPAGAKPSHSATPPAAKPSSGGLPSRSLGLRKGLPPLSSRSGAVSRGAVAAALKGTPAPKPQEMLGKLGVVQAESASLRAGKDTDSRALSIVTKGTNLAVVADDGAYYGVLMVDNTVGWVPKAQVELIDYDVKITLPSEPVPAAPSDPPATPDNGADSGGDFTQGLSPRHESLLRDAFTYLGVPYVWAGNTKRGIDCSGFLKAVFGKAGINLPRHSGDQIVVGSPVRDVADLHPGDRLYFAMKRGGPISHCGMYIGNGYFIHASSNQGKVGVDQITKRNYWNALVAARRDWE